MWEKFAGRHATVAWQATQSCVVEDMVVALALSGGAVMAALAVAGNAHVREVRRAPRHRRMTDRAVLRGRDMVVGLALGPGAVVAALAVAGNAHVEKFAGRQPTVAWQATQSCVVRIWLLPLPSAVVPLWQLWQLPVIPVWEKFAGRHATDV
ncbi:MAG: hypothetical protein R3E64_05220 [Halioglobus sp.]